MSDIDFDAYKKMVKEHQENDKPTQWCDWVYQEAKGDYKKVFWADLEPSPYLVEFLKTNVISKPKKAVVIGCGVGDDAQALSDAGYDVTAFDIAPTAIELCKKRYAKSSVNYCVENLFDYPKEWFESFDLVYECNTIQVLAGKYRTLAREKMSSLLGKDGVILVSCRSREKDKQLESIPLPLDKKEIDTFKTIENLNELSFLAYDDNQEPSVPHFFAIYQKS